VIFLQMFRELIRNVGVPKLSSSCFLSDIRGVTHIYSKVR